MKFNLILLFLFTGNLLIGQDSLICSFQSDASYFTSDQYLNIYQINGRNEIIKYNCTNGDSITYSNKQLGRPSYIDVTNPMKVLVLYPDFSSLVVLDNKLSEITSIKFNSPQNGLNYKPTAVCREEEGDRIWIYDDLSRKLIQFDETGNKLAESEAFDDIFEQLPEVSQLIASGQKIYLFDHASGVFVFDAYGSYESNIEFKFESTAQMFLDNIIYSKGNMFYSLNLKTGEVKQLPVSIDNSIQVNIQISRLFVRTDDKIYIYGY